MAVMQKDEHRKSFRGGLFRRLFGYVKPHLRLVLAALALVLVVTALDLYRPILIGEAIDEHIENYASPYAHTTAERGEIRFRGDYLTRKDTENAAEYALLVYFEDSYWYFDHLSAADTEALTALAEEPEGESAGDTLTLGAYTGAKLTGEELALLRAPDLDGVLRIALIYAAVLVVTCIANLGERWLLELTGQNIIYSIRQELFHHVHSLPLRFFDTNPVGRIVTRITNDVESLNQMYTQIIVRLFQNVVLIFGYAVVMVSIDGRLALLCFAFLPVILALTVYFRGTARKIYRTVRTKLAELNSFLSENISGMKLIQVFAREREKQAEFQGRTQELYKSQIKELMVMAVFRPTIFMISNLALALVLYRAGSAVLTGALTLGTLYIFSNYIRSFFEPIMELAEQFSTLQNAMASAEKIFTLLDEENPIREPETPQSLGAVKGKIEFRHVWFAYEKEDYVLRDVSFVIHPGEKVAFVGATGAGKSSILNLIGRYYEIQKGQILIDDVDIRALSTEELRAAIGQVQQDVFVFTGDIKSNIRLLNAEISDRSIVEAAAAVNASRFIENLPREYDEPVTERGSTLSAGQRQLLSFARTLAFDPRILVLDEATANIDTETESLIQEALETLMQGRTTIMVAHRLSTIQHADNILVMHKGKIRESGTHQELLQKNGIYKKLYEIQQ
ncbi:MAG: ABC transporter ATP-binding protein [bacterium]